MSAAALPRMVSYRQGVLPWASGTDDDRRLRRIQQRVVGAVLLLCLVIPWLPVSPPVEPPKPDETVRLARVILPPIEKKPEAKPAPKPPVPVAAPVPAPRAETPRPPKPKPTPEPQVAQQRKGTPASVAAARDPKPGKPPGEDLAQARQRAAGVGLLAMKDELSQISGAPVAVQLNADIKPGPGIGSGTGAGVGAGREEGVPTRAMITATAARGSGGIATGGMSRDTGGGGLAGRSTTLVEGRIGGGGGGGPGGGAGGGTAASGDGRGGSPTGGSVQRAGGGKASRSIEEIRLVFERHKGAIYALYNRALREDPSLQGKVVLELRIAPSGGVDGVRIVSSELSAADDLEKKLMARVRQFDFGAKDVEVMVVSWPVDFLPS